MCFVSQMCACERLSVDSAVIMCLRDCVYIFVRIFKCVHLCVCVSVSVHVDPILYCQHL